MTMTAHHVVGGSVGPRHRWRGPRGSELALRLDLAIRSGATIPGATPPGAVAVESTGALTLVWVDGTRREVPAQRSLEELAVMSRDVAVDLRSYVTVGRRRDGALIVVDLESWRVLGVTGPGQVRIISRLVEDLGSLAGRRPPIWCWNIELDSSGHRVHTTSDLQRALDESARIAHGGDRCVLVLGQIPGPRPFRLPTGVSVVVAGSTSRGLALDYRASTWRLDPLAWDLNAIVGQSADSPDG